MHAVPPSDLLYVHATALPGVAQQAVRMAQGLMIRPRLTCSHNAHMALQLKRPLTESYQSKKEAVARLITRLGLDACAHVPIGDPLAKGISGGQAKVRRREGLAMAPGRGTTGRGTASVG